MNQSFVPLVQRGLFWREGNALLVADLHVGKEATFRRAGLAVPACTSSATLNRVAQMLAETQASQLIILGDLFHARSSLSPAIRSLVSNFLLNLNDVRVTLVKGNHDRATGQLPPDWPLTIVEEPWSISNLWLTHYPSTPPDPSQVCIAGHLHPAIRLRGAMPENKLACFHWDETKRCMTLPAVGEFTGTAVVRPARHDRVWIICETDVIELDSRLW